MITIKNLHPDISEFEIRDILVEFGTIVSLSISILEEATSQNVMAFVEMLDRFEEQQIIDTLNGDLIKGRPIVVEQFEAE